MNDNPIEKILILAANPKNSTPLRLDEEVREIDEGLKRSKYRDRFELEQKWAVRPKDLQRAILDLKPQIVHFSGHGVGNGGLALEDETGQAKLVSTQAIARLFKLFADRVECVLLNACYSEIQAKAIAQHIPYVIGMKQAIGDDAARAFAVGFYDALGAGENIEFAFNFACNRIDIEGIPEYLTPVLFKNGNVEVGSASAQPPEGSTAAPGERKMIPIPEELGSQATLDSPLSVTRPPNEKQFIEEARSVVQQEQPSQSVNISGGQSGQFAVAGGNVTQTQQFNQENPAKQLTVTEVVESIDRIAALFKSSALSEELKNKATTHLGAAKEEVKEKEPEKEYAAKSLQKAVNILKSANETVTASEGLWNKVQPILKQLLPWLGVASHFLSL
jgi:CHAT domain